MNSETYQRYIEESLARREEYERQEARIARVAEALAASMLTRTHAVEELGLSEVVFLRRYAVGAARKLEPVVLTMVLELLDSQANLKAARN